MKLKVTSTWSFSSWVKPAGLWVTAEASSAWAVKAPAWPAAAAPLTGFWKPAPLAIEAVINNPITAIIVWRIYASFHPHQMQFFCHYEALLRRGAIKALTPFKIKD